MTEFVEFFISLFDQVPPANAKELVDFCYNIMTDCIIDAKGDLGMESREEIGICFRDYKNCVFPDAITR